MPFTFGLFGSGNVNYRAAFSPLTNVIYDLNGEPAVSRQSYSCWLWGLRAVGKTSYFQANLQEEVHRGS